MVLFSKKKKSISEQKQEIEKDIEKQKEIKELYNLKNKRNQLKKSNLKQKGFFKFLDNTGNIIKEINARLDKTRKGSSIKEVFDKGEIKGTNPLSRTESQKPLGDTFFK